MVAGLLILYSMCPCLNPPCPGWPLTQRINLVLSSLSSDQVLSFSDLLFAGKLVEPGVCAALSLKKTSSPLQPEVHVTGENVRVTAPFIFSLQQTGASRCSALFVTEQMVALDV